MDKCSNHKKEVAGITDMKLLAEMIGDLHYETLADLLKELYEKLRTDSIKDWDGNKLQLSNELLSAAISIRTAWKISEKFMKSEDA